MYRSPWKSGLPSASAGASEAGKLAPGGWLLRFSPNKVPAPQGARHLFQGLLCLSLGTETTVLHLWQTPLAELGYDHFGDLDHIPKDGVLIVPVERTDKTELPV